MKQILLLSSIVLLLSACEFDLHQFRNETDAIIEDGKNSYYNIVEEVQEIQNKIIETKTKIDETFTEVEDAMNKIQETKEALEKITE